MDRKTARRYVTAAVEAGLARDSGLAQLTDELVGQVAQVVRPVRPGGHGLGREQLEACHVHALIFTAVCSRHMFVWLSFTQTLAAFIAGCGARGCSSAGC